LSATIAVAVAGMLTSDTLLRGLARGRALADVRTPVAWAAALLAAPAAGWTLWLLGEGRRVRDLPGRALLTFALATLCGWIAYRIARALLRASGRRRTQVALLLGVASALALAVDAQVLRRLYPAFHVALAGLGVAGVLLAVALAWRPSERARRASALLALVLALAAVPALLAASRAPNLRFALEVAAPLTGKLLRLAPPTPFEGARDAAVATEAKSPWLSQRGLDQRGRDVLLITIDALRADRLRALGGSGLMPHLDRLASEGAVFTRAYTTTPHTSYAMVGLMTASYADALVRVGVDLGDRVTLAQLLRRHGYRTAAFYPPAIFYVDTNRFAALAQAQFGFEYVKAMYAKGSERVQQLQAYLDDADRERPVFAWVHLFEPHEPYDPPEAFARGDAPVQRYDGEVAAADAAVGQLVQTFRRARPDAIVVVTSDHGEEFGDHGGQYHGTTLFDEQVRVPVVWSSPDVAPRRVDAPIEIIDITTTLLSVLGVPRDVRMQGDDLGPLLAGAAASEGTAFAALGLSRMVTDGRHKAVCDERGACRLFDLADDPGERRDLAVDEPARLGPLRAALAQHTASLAAVRALDAEDAWPEALARAQMGDATAANDLVPLLGVERVDVREASVDAVASLGLASVLPTLARMRERDPAPQVRAAAALASLRLGDDTALDSVHGLLDATEVGVARRRAAALLLAARGDASGLSLLAELALDATADEKDRRAATTALGDVGGQAQVKVLGQLMSEVRLRADVAAALAKLGGDQAADILLAALAEERYPPARGAEARALVALRERRVVPLLVRFLGTESLVPDGVELLRAMGALSQAGGAELSRSPRARAGAWSCEDAGCRPDVDAALVLPSRAWQHDVRLVVRVQAQRASTLTLGGQSMRVQQGASEVALRVEADRATQPIGVVADEAVAVVAFALVPIQPDVAPPLPEPWDGGVPSTPER
jgi:arylsulfatase A-like enzyme